ncbi:MAG: hypothetical protein REI94_19425 [Moraxellaceae bacterium]|nr:hypothetical protein [Moraxellaceae bacterium]
MQAASTPLRAAWYVPAVNERRAGLRYRCLYPIAALRKLGVDASVFDADAGLPACVVFDAWSIFPTVAGAEKAAQILPTARKLREQGVRILLDNCDNQFSGNADEGWAKATSDLQQLATMADVVVTCSDELAHIMQARCGLETTPRVIGDPIEERIAYMGDSFWRSLLSPGRKRSWLRYLGHRARLAAERSRGITPLVWFGAHGNSFSDGGMLDLARITPLLAEIHRDHPVSLTVISNNRGKFETHFADHPFPTHYMDWDRITFLQMLRLHAISLLPISLNDFTRCKSANRLVLSLHHGLNVVADAIPSYGMFAPVCHLDDWESGLRRYLRSPQLRAEHVRAGRQLADQHFSHECIGRQWQAALQAATENRHG